MKVAAVVCALGLFTLVGESPAQTNVLVRTPYLPPEGCTISGCPTSVFTYEPDARALRGLTPATAAEGAYVTPDGALLVAFDPSGPRLTVLDRATGTETFIPLPAAATAVAGNPSRVEVYLNDATRGLALSPAGARTSQVAAASVPLAWSPGGAPAAYVRVRAENYTGVSAPSNEVVVQVP